MQSTEMEGTFTYRKNSTVSDISVNYTGLFEGEEDKTGWEKQTIHYALGQEERLKSHIKKCIVGFSDSLEDDAAEIFQDLMIDLYGASDYDALGEGNIKTGVANYVLKRLGYIIKTYIKNMYTVRKNRVRNTIEDEDGDIVEIFDNISSGEDCYEDILYGNPDSFLRPLEGRRYEFGFDLFQVMYIHMVALEQHLNEQICWSLVSMLNNVDIKDVKDGYIKIMGDEDVVAVVHAINKSQSLESLERYVHGVEQIKRVIDYHLHKIK